MCIIISLLIITGVNLISFLVSSSHSFASEDFYRNYTKSNNTPHILISHKNNAFEGRLVTLDASRSFDPDRDPIQFTWKKLSPVELNVELLNDNSAIASFIVPPVKTETVVLFELSVNDGNGNTDNDQFRVTISKNIAENQKQDQPVKGEPERIKQKDQADKPKSKLLSLSPKVGKPEDNNNMEEGMAKSTISSDSKQPGLNDNPSKSRSIADNKIEVNAGKNLEVASGTVVTLHGTILTNVDSKQIKIAWTQKKGPSIHLSSNHILDPHFIAPHVEKNVKIVFELTVLDKNGLVDSDYMSAIVLANSSNELSIGQSVGRLSAKQFGTTSSTSDTIPPTIVSLTPIYRIRNVPITSKIMATFSEPMLSSSITSSTFTLKMSGNTTTLQEHDGLAVQTAIRLPYLLHRLT